MKKYLLKLALILAFMGVVLNADAQRPPITSVAYGWITPPSCDSCDGVAYIVISGFTGGPFTYSWSPGGSTNDTAFNLCSGTTYTVTVRNASEAVVVTRVLEPVDLTPPSGCTQARCDEVCNGTAHIDNDPGYGLTITAFDWFPGTPTGDGTDSIYNLCPYSELHCAITLSNGCIDTIDFDPPAPFQLGAVQSFTSAICRDSCDGSADLFLYTLVGKDTVAAGGIIDLYEWSPGAPLGDSTSSISHLCYGGYVCYVTDTAGCVDTFNFDIDYITECVACYDCLSSFAPIAGKKYIVSGWAMESGAAATKASYTYPKITVLSPSVAYTSSAFTPSGRIIDGWQKIEAEFVIPGAASDLQLKLECTTGDCFFDDIRVFPYDGSMKSYVYDPVSMRLVAELDERNYATLYQYDEEGKLIRVKKETEKGVMTIKESRNNTSK